MLEVLDLSYNKITKLSTHVLRIPNHQADWLKIDLSYNEIQKIEYVLLSTSLHLLTLVFCIFDTASMHRGGGYYGYE